MAMAASNKMNSTCARVLADMLQAALLAAALNLSLQKLSQKKVLYNMYATNSPTKATPNVLEISKASTMRKKCNEQIARCHGLKKIRRGGIKRTTARSLGKEGPQE